MTDFITTSKLINLAFGISLILVGYIIAKQLSRFLDNNVLQVRFTRHHAMLFRKMIFYFISLMFLVAGLEQIGFNLSVLLGAAGIFTVALSFASQTAASNLVSGIFLLFEHPFKVGDAIEVKGITGVVDSIDLLSTKLKTGDNKWIRIPNEAIMKSEITNLSHYETRRIDLIFGVAYESNISHVKSILLTIANHCKQVIKEPAPNVVVDNFTASSVEVKMMVWVNTKDIGAAQDYLQEMIKKQFEEEGIQVPAPQVTIHQS